jgi:hypothetical protein
VAGPAPEAAGCAGSLGARDRAEPDRVHGAARHRLPAERAGQPEFIGQLDEVAIWNRALTDPEITQWYMATKP